MIRLPRLPQLKPRERLLAMGSMAVVMMVVLDRLVISPWAQHTQHIREGIRQMEEGLKVNQRLLARKDRATVEHGRYQPYLKPELPDDLQTAALVKEIQGLAEQNHITLGEIKPLATESDSETRRYALDVRFECTLSEWVQFVFGIESSPSLYEVVRAALVSQEEHPDRLQGTLRVMNASLNSEGQPGVSQSGGSHVASAR